MTHHTSLAVKIHQFTCISTNTHIPMQENGNGVQAYCGYAAVDARRIAIHFLNVRQNHIMCIMCPIRLQGVVFTGVRYRSGENAQCELTVVQEIRCRKETQYTFYENAQCSQLNKSVFIKFFLSIILFPTFQYRISYSHQHNIFTEKSLKIVTKKNNIKNL